MNKHRLATTFAAASLLGLLTAAPGLAQAKPGPGTSGSGTNCAVTASGVGAPLYVTGTGYAAGTFYTVEFIWPNNNGDAMTSALANSAGDIAISSYAYWSGTYNVRVLSAKRGTQLAACATTVS